MAQSTCAGELRSRKKSANCDYAEEYANEKAINQWFLYGGRSVFAHTTCCSCLAAPTMKCDRLLKDISGKDLALIESNLPHSDAPFLKPGQHFKDIASADQAIIKKYNLDLPSMIGKVDGLIGAAHAFVDKFTLTDQTKVSKMAGSLQYVNDKINRLTRTLDMIFKQPAKPGVQVINCGTPPDASEWDGPNPFAFVPTNPNWTCWSRCQAPVIDGDRVYIVATITWGGAQRVSLTLTCL